MRSAIRTAVLLLLTLTALPMLAQNANVNGRVTDPTGATVPGAIVSLVNTGTKVQMQTMTSRNGTFLLPPVAPGHYQATVVAVGFATETITEITLEIGEARALNVVLKLESAKTSVVVTDAPPELNTEEADRSLLLEPTFVQNIPLNIRNPLQLIADAAGVTKGDDGLSGQNSTSESRTNTFRINGAKGATTEVLIDGATNTTAYYNQDAGIPTVDGVQETRIYTDAYSPEFGRTSGGVVAFALRSGTNRLHGSAFEYFRSEAMDANGYNANVANLPRGSFSRNQFGGSIGGPVVVPHLYNGKGRTFWFFSYDGLRDTSAGSFHGTVPTALERKGDFSQTFDAKGNLIVIYNPSTTTTGTNYARTPVAGNNVNNIATLNPLGVALVNLYPLPNVVGTGGSDLNNFFSNAPNTDDNNAFDIRIDHQLTSKQSLFGHITDFSNHINYSDYYGNGLSPEDANDRIPGKNITVNHTWAIKSNLLFEQHFSWAHSESNRHELVDKTPASLGFSSQVAPGITATVSPSISIAGPPAVGSYSALGNVYPYETNYSSVYQYAAALTWVKGKHALKAGVDLRRYPTQLWDPEQMSISSGGSSTGSNFTDGFTKGTTINSDSGNGVADLLLGLGTVGSGYEPETKSVHDYRAVFLQDEFKITPKLIVTYGLRYNYETGDVEQSNLLNYLDTAGTSPLQAKIASLKLTGGVGVPGLYGTSRELQIPGKMNFDPRVGIAYNLNDSTILHAGFGIFRHPLAAWQQFPNADGGIRTSTSVDAQANGVTPLAGYQLSAPFPNGLTTPDGTNAGLGIDLGDSIEGPLRKQNIAYQENYSLDLQRSLPGKFVVTAAYAGNEGVHLMVNAQLNQLPTADEALSAGLNTLVSNPLYGLIDPASSINTPTVKQSQLLKPFPQFQNFEAINVGLGHSSYNAGQLTVEHRLEHGLALLFAYTYSKSIDNVGEQTSVAGTMGAITNTYCLSCDRSRSDQNQTNVIHWTTRYELPFGPNQHFLNRGVLGRIVGGWSATTSYSYNTGQPLALSYTNVSTLGSSSTLSRPNIVPGVSDKVSGGSQIKLDGTGVYFNKAAFAATPTYSFGTASRYLADVNAPSYSNLDAMIEKSTILHSGYVLSLRGEFFNALNHTVFGGPTTSFTSATFGQEATLNQTNTPRNVQVSARFSF